MWATDAVILVRRLGYLLRADLNLHPTDPHEERMIIDDFNEKFNSRSPGLVGSTWYVLSSHWWQQWCRFTGVEVSVDCSPMSTTSLQKASTIASLPISPQRSIIPVIDNSSLLDETGKLRIGLSHGVHYELLSETCWRVLKGWYTSKGADLPCRVIDLSGVKELEVYLLRFNVWCVEESGTLSPKPRVLECSRVTPMSEVSEEALKLFVFSNAQVRLLHRIDENGTWELAPEHGTPHSLNIIGHDLLVDTTRKGLEHLGSKETRTDQTVVGLRNLGNTCYMNATIQCLCHLRPIQEYFAAQYINDLHPKSKRSLEWGMAGKVAVAFADLMSEVSSSKRSAVAPDVLKTVLGRFRPMFAGSDQQDASEFLIAIFEGLGEDLNRRADKPYIELKDSGDRPDVDVAKEYWDASQRRDWSVISALFAWQFKNTNCCNTCGERNAKFEEMKLVPVPLTDNDFKWISCTVVEFGPRKTEVVVRVSKKCSVADVISGVSGLIGYSASELVAANVTSNYISERLPNYEDVLDHVHLFHAPGYPGDVQVNLVHRRLTKAAKYFLNPYRPELFATPQILCLQPMAKAREVYAHVWRFVRLVVPDFTMSSSTYPFKLCRVTSDGSACSECGWREGCQGHYVPCDDQEVILSQGTLALDWDATILSEYYNERSVTVVAEHESVALAKIERDAPEQLHKCLDALVKKQIRTEYCRICTEKAGEHTETEKTKEDRIWALPPILILQLNRFRIDDNGVAYKLRNLVHFPLQLDVMAYLDQGPKEVAGSTLSREKTIFSLHGVVNHSGSTLTSGHYLAYIKRPNGKWACCDDTHCYDMEEKQVVTASAYLLFYVRSDIEKTSVSEIFPAANVEETDADAGETLLQEIRKSGFPKAVDVPIGQHRPSPSNTRICVVS